MNWKVFIFWAIFVAAATVRVVFSFWDKPPDIGACLKQTVDGIGIVEVEPSRTESGQILVVNAETMKSDNLECASDLLIRMETKMYPSFSYGDRVQFSGKLNAPFNFSGSKNDPNVRTFDYEGYLAKDGIYYEIKSAKVSLLGNNSVLDTGTGGGKIEYYWNWLANNIGPQAVTSALFRLKIGFVGNLNRTLGEPHAALAAGLVVGEKSALGKDLLDDFRTVGLIHIVVLSGFNITIVADAIRRLLSFLPRVWGIVIGGIGIALFGVLVGGGATVVRSCFMAGIALGADLIRRDYNVTRALIFAGLIMLIQNPMILLHDPSFQLSFLATLGLILLASPIEKRLAWITEKFGLRGIVASCFATQIFVSPFILYLMGQLSIIGVVVNILVLPFIPITMLFVFLTGAVGFLSLTASQIMAWATHLLLAYELFIVEHFARIPFAAIRLPAFSIWWVAGFYAGFGTIFILKSHRKALHKRFISMSAGKKIVATISELNLIKDFGSIPRPHERLFIASMSEENMRKIGAKRQCVFISRRSIKHIMERRKSKAEIVFGELINVILKPTKIANNSLKRKNSFLFVRMTEIIIAAVIEITEKPGNCQVVSAFLMDRKTYEKLTDISGRAEFPPFELPS